MLPVAWHLGFSCHQSVGTAGTKVTGLFVVCLSWMNLYSWNPAYLFLALLFNDWNTPQAADTYHKQVIDEVDKMGPVSWSDMCNKLIYNYLQFIRFNVLALSGKRNKSTSALVVCSYIYAIPGACVVAIWTIVCYCYCLPYPLWCDNYKAHIFDSICPAWIRVWSILLSYFCLAFHRFFIHSHWWLFFEVCIWNRILSRNPLLHLFSFL